MNEAEYKKSEGEFYEKQTEILKEIPIEFRAALSYMAWEHGHSSGFNEVLMILTDTIFHLKEPIKKFEERIKNE